MARVLIATQLGLEMMTCGQCGTKFAIEANLQQALQRSHRTFYCPNGHSRYYAALSDVEVAQREARELRGRLQDALLLRDKAIAENVTLTKEAKRLHKRAHAGVCPECNRHFMQLERHMKNKHGSSDA